MQRVKQQRGCITTTLATHPLFPIFFPTHHFPSQQKFSPPKFFSPPPLASLAPARAWRVYGSKISLHRKMCDKGNFS